MLTKLSKKIQVVLPKSICESLKLKPGITFNVIEYDGRIELFRVHRCRDMRGFLRGIDTSVAREHDRSRLEKKS